MRCQTSDGEVTVDTTKRCLVIHDGVTAGGKPVFGFLSVTPTSPITIQILAGALRITGGDAETFALEVFEPAATSPSQPQATSSVPS